MAADLRTQYLPVVQREAARAGLDWRVLDALIAQESAYRADVFRGDPSGRGDGGKAVGPGQLHVAAAQDVGLSPQDRFDPVRNIAGAADYLALAYRGLDAGDHRTALARYNQGRGQTAASMPRAGWGYADSVLGRLGQAPAAAAPAAPTTSASLGIGGSFAGVDYPQVPALESIATTLQLAPAVRPSRQPAPMSLTEIMRYANLKPSRSWLA